MRNTTRPHPAKVRTAAGFLHQESGSVTIFAIVGFAMCMVIIGLVFDVGRVMAIHTEVSSFADRAAIAAAKELDGRSDALSRAIAAAAGDSSAVGEGRRFSLSEDRRVKIHKLTFLSEIGADPAPNVASPKAGDVVLATWTEGETGPTVVRGTLADAVRDSRYVLVDVTPEKEDYILFPLLGAFVPSMDKSMTVEPQAMAGLERSVCNSPPIMMCNPREATFGSGASFTFDRKQMIRARLRTGNDVMRPGDMKILQLANGMSVEEAMGAINSSNLCTSNLINVRRNNGGSQPITAGLNMRFDMYNGTTSSYRGRNNFAPARVVQKGRRDNCSTQKSSDSTPLPRDNCFMPARNGSQTLRNGVPAGIAGTGCVSYNGRAIAGNGQDAGVLGPRLREYWDINQPSDHPRPTNSQFNTFSRYDLYRFEVETPSTPRTSDENGNATCSAAATTTEDLRDRRVFPVAIVNCLEHNASGNVNNVPVEAYAEVFLTEPAANTQWWNATNTDVFLEVIGRIRKDLPPTVLREYPVVVR